jgi:AcrR family transcriptional regulator
MVSSPSLQETILEECRICDAGGKLTQKIPDLRVRRTHILLKEALIDLINDKGFDAISVGDIAERAMVNRATFYRHYPDKYALVTAVFEEAAERMIHELGPMEQRIKTIDWMVHAVDQSPDQIMSEDVKRALAAWTGLFEHFAKNEKLYKTMLGKQGSSWFTAQMRDYMTRNLSERFKAAHALEMKKNQISDPMSDEVAIICTANLFVGMITWWLENGKDIPPQQIAMWCLRYMIHGLYPFIQNLEIPRPVE